MHAYLQVPTRAGPGPSDPSSVMWMYHSHTSEVGDTYAGLTGAIIISRAGATSASGVPKDVDRSVRRAPDFVGVDLLRYVPCQRKLLLACAKQQGW